MKLKYVLLMFTPVLLLASEAGGHGATDIIPRTINFLIFAAILYYLIAEPAKQFYLGRKSNIATKLDSIQVKLRESSNKKESAQQKVEEAKASARVLIETAKKEAILLSEKIAADVSVEIDNLEKAFNDKVSIEKRKMTRSVVSEILDDMFKEGSISLDQNEIVKIVNKKVA
ncbi:MAG: F0F1 ATP synthase subunit B [Sulfurospirillaceae bacterium]|nr:F0F1 ATP synthase subunit B [Sulfurospirillaceae bacterium]